MAQRTHYHADPHSYPTRRSSDLECSRGSVALGARSSSRSRSRGCSAPWVESSRRAARRDTAATTPPTGRYTLVRSEEHTSELQSHHDLVCRLLLEKKKL